MKELSECRVLIVDDVPANIDVLVQALRGDHQLSVALDGAAALRTADKLLPDLVLLDIMMPGMDGYEVCRQLRASPRTRDIPVMFLSSLEDVQDKAKGFEAGGNDYLVKPFEILEVKARVRSLLKAKAYADAVKEKIAYDLRIAREIQMGILPPDVAAIAQGTGLETHALLEPAQAVGGDLYEALRTPDGNLVLVLGDVSGKGIPAALFMAVTMTLIRAMAPDSHAPEEIVRRVSDALVSQNPRNMFVTLLCGIYDPRSGKLTYAGAGHPAPVLVRGNQAQFLSVEAALPVGVMSGLMVPSTSVDLQVGDLVVFYTDGVTEAFDAAGNLYGESQLLEALALQSGRAAAEASAALLASVRTHAGNHPQSDDIAILTLRRTQ
ncbi:MAG TPA: SpoIIE family protein phosphatase [Candidatus Paceibacterota bacterium]|nr:SpoIIE family protein phosphatase [Verrucomicrobiota bacterium]HRY49441.1 SpoIIE family protein phosphatase [Candidatus Paceibacterota bacterium]